MNRIIMTIVLIFYVLYQWWRYSRSVANFNNIYIVLLHRKTKNQDRVWVLVLVRVLWVTISIIYWLFQHSLFKLTFKTSSIFYPIRIPRRKWRRSSLFETRVRETMTFAYIMTFHFSSKIRERPKLYVMYVGRNDYYWLLIGS